MNYTATKYLAATLLMVASTSLLAASELTITLPDQLDKAVDAEISILHRSKDIEIDPPWVLDNASEEYLPDYSHRIEYCQPDDSDQAEEKLNYTHEVS